VEITPSERELLLRIYQAERRWADAGHDDRSFLLLHLGGLARDMDHPGWDDSWPTPTSRQIDDLGERGLLRVEPHSPNMNNRTFHLSAQGRRVAPVLTQVPNDPEPAPADRSSAPPALDDVLVWFAGLDRDARADGQRLLSAVEARFGGAHLEEVSGLLLDLEDALLIKFTNPMATLSGWPASARIGKGSDFRITVPGLDRVNREPSPGPGTTFKIHGDVGQIAGRDFMAQGDASGTKTVQKVQGSSAGEIRSAPRRTRFHALARSTWAIIAGALSILLAAGLTALFANGGSSRKPAAHAGVTTTVSGRAGPVKSGSVSLEYADNTSGSPVFASPHGAPVGGGLPRRIPYGTKVYVRCWSPNEVSGMTSVTALYLIASGSWAHDYVVSDTMSNGGPLGNTNTPNLDPHVQRCPAP
jgi:hypothetical protein